MNTEPIDSVDFNYIWGDLAFVDAEYLKKQNEAFERIFNEGGEGVGNIGYKQGYADAINLRRE